MSNQVMHFWKVLWKVLKAAAVSLSVLLVAVLVLVFLARSAMRDEVARAVSPDGSVVATVVEIDGGATTSFAYEVLLSKPGSWSWKHEVASLNGAVRNESAYGVNLHWQSPTQLDVEYLSARLATAVDAPVSVGDRLVHVSLREGIEDPSAPGGGMLDNLESGPDGG